LPDGRARVCVEDRGPGVDPSVAQTLFEPFVTTKPKGMGMGLSICRTIIEAHGGRLDCDPGPGGGSVFSFELPSEPAEPGPCAGPSD
jgi:two-component system sensor kinase FixL